MKNTISNNHQKPSRSGMEKFEQALIQFANSNPNFSQNNDTNSSTLIQQRFSQFFPDFQTPNHPPYAAMIHKAIWELNKKGGSSEESISKYIKKEYVDLPWAHSTLLKHHLEKLCDGKEICMTSKQRYSLAGGEDSEPISSSTSEKRLKRKRDSESGKKNNGPCKKGKKMKSVLDTKPGKINSKKSRKRKRKEKRMVDLQETEKQIAVRDEDVQPLDEMVDEQEVDLEIEDQSEKVLSITEFDDIGNGNQSVELCNEVEANLKQNNEVTGSDIQIQEENNDDERVQMLQNQQLLQLEQSPDSENLLLKDGKRIYTRSQIKSTLKNDASASPELADTPTNVKNLSEEKKHRMEIIEGKEAKQTPSAVSTQMNGQRAKLRSTQKNTVTESTDMETQQKSTSPSLEKRLIEVDEPTQVQETGGSEQDRQPEEPKDETQENKPRKRGRPKKSEQSAEKSKAGSRCSKRKRVENEGLGKSKSTNKKNQPKNKRHKMTRRNTKKKSK